MFYALICLQVCYGVELSRLGLDISHGGKSIHWFGRTVSLDTLCICFGAHYSSMLVTVMSIEKFFALYFPLKAKSYCTVGTAKWVTSILALVIAGLNFPLLIVVKLDGIICILANLGGIMRNHGHNVILTSSYCFNVTCQCCNNI